MTKILAVFFLIFLSSCAKNWSYDGHFGPKNWGNVEEFKFCKIGYNQSPINIEGEFKDEDLDFSYSNSEVEKKPTKHLLRLEFDSKDFVLRLKRKYLIRHIEFHHPSEHLVSSEAHSLEMQIYHKSDNEQWLALAFFLEVGKENSNFEQLTKFLAGKENVGKLNLSKIVKEKDKLFFYDGSFTTPPCTEGVKWYVAKTPITVSKEQMNQIIKLAIFAKTNARPTQAFHPERF
ncbi:MAG: carbonic anhydrase family protein [Rickettsiales bacterium]|nr:carbonic anhydrase family protein [Rickettsiales bacterium]